MKRMIDQFASFDLFGRDNYEYYARVTGRVLRVQDEWICSFRYPAPPRGKSAQQNYAREYSMFLLSIHDNRSQSNRHFCPLHFRSATVVGNGKNLAAVSMRSMGAK